MPYITDIGVEYFYVSPDEFTESHKDSWLEEAMKDALNNTPLETWPEDAVSDAATMLSGWYWWSCQPGCLPDGDPQGPFNSKIDCFREIAELYEVDVEKSL